MFDWTIPFQPCHNATTAIYQREIPNRVVRFVTLFHFFSVHGLFLVFVSKYNFRCVALCRFNFYIAFYLQHIYFLLTMFWPNSKARLTTNCSKITTDMQQFIILFFFSKMTQQLFLEKVGFPFWLFGSASAPLETDLFYPPLSLIQPRYVCFLSSDRTNRSFYRM